MSLVGRANVGKSTLFNRLSERRKAIVSPMPGTTRDWNTSTIQWRDKTFELVDTGGLDQLGDTELDRAIETYARKAIERSDLVVFVMDARSGLTPEDRRIAQELRKRSKQVIVAVNKCDTSHIKESAQAEAFGLGFTSVSFVSASNGVGTGDLLDEMHALLKKTTSGESAIPPIKVAIVGRPNVGKSSFLNAIVGEERAIVSDIAHTTRDINQFEFVYKNTTIQLLDTAGIRRRSKLLNSRESPLKSIERDSVHAALSSMQVADVVILVYEAHKKMTDQDKRLAELAQESRRGIIIAINKWDLVPDKSPETINQYIKYFSAELPFLSWAPMIFISSLNKQRVKEVLDLTLEVQAERTKRLTDQECEDVLRLVERKYQPKAKMTVAEGKQRPYVKLFAMTQANIDAAPPIFIIFTPKPKQIAPAVVKLVEKHLREKHEFLGTPIFITTQARSQ